MILTQEGPYQLEVHTKGAVVIGLVFSGTWAVHQEVVQDITEAQMLERLMLNVLSTNK